MKKEQEYKYYCEAVAERCRDIEMLVNEMMPDFDRYNTGCTVEDKIRHMKQIYERLCAIKNDLFGHRYGRV